MAASICRKLSGRHCNNCELPRLQVSLNRKAATRGGRLLQPMNQCVRCSTTNRSMSQSCVHDQLQHQDSMILPAATIACWAASSRLHSAKQSGRVHDELGTGLHMCARWPLYFRKRTASPCDNAAGPLALDAVMARVRWSTVRAGPARIQTPSECANSYHSKSFN
jgi:hypothetical protein